VAGQLERQFGDLGLGIDRILRHRRDDLLQRLRVIGKLIDRDRHATIESRTDPATAAKAQADSLCRDLDMGEAAHDTRQRRRDSAQIIQILGAANPADNAGARQFGRAVAPHRPHAQPRRWKPPAAGEGGDANRRGERRRV